MQNRVGAKFDVDELSTLSVSSFRNARESTSVAFGARVGAVSGVVTFAGARRSVLRDGTSG